MNPVQPAGSGRGEQHPALSNREKQVLLLICDGVHSKEIAQRLGISPKTVEYHKSALHRRLGINETALLVRYAIRTGMIEP
jgi:DNA-binding CsgD family transcriptional regulator